MSTLNSFLDERTKKAKESAASIFTLGGYNKAEQKLQLFKMCKELMTVDAKEIKHPGGQPKLRNGSIIGRKD